jgi:hypothetical protein
MRALTLDAMRGNAQHLMRRRRTSELQNLFGDRMRLGQVSELSITAFRAHLHAEQASAGRGGVCARA